MVTSSSLFAVALACSIELTIRLFRQMYTQTYLMYSNCRSYNSNNPTTILCRCTSFLHLRISSNLARHGPLTLPIHVLRGFPLPLLPLISSFSYRSSPICFTCQVHFKTFPRSPSLKPTPHLTSSFITLSILVIVQKVRKHFFS